MWSSLTNSILPIFAILGVGYVLFRTKLFDVATAQAINKFSFYIATPALVFSIVSRSINTAFDGFAIAVYLLAEIVVYLAVFCFLHFKLKFEKGEALLLGMTAIFVNHVFFILPIATKVYGISAAQPIAGIILVDSMVLFCGTVLVMDLMKTPNPSPLKVLGLLMRNPLLVAAFLGIASWPLQQFIPAGLFTYTEFAGAAAAPVSLFALGIILASKPIFPIGKIGWSVITIKSFIHPLIVFFLAGAFAFTPEWKHLTVLVAAGPCGATPFVIALQYGVRTEIIAKAILVSTLVSLATLSALTG